MLNATVKMKGNAIINIAGQELDLSLIDGDIELSAKTLKEVKSVKVLGGKSNFYRKSDIIL